MFLFFLVVVGGFGVVVFLNNSKNGKVLVVVKGVNHDQHSAGYSQTSSLLSTPVQPSPEGQQRWSFRVKPQPLLPGI